MQNAVYEKSLFTISGRNDKEKKTKRNTSKCSRCFDLSGLFPVKFGPQVNQVQIISHVHHSHPDLIYRSSQD